MQMRKYPWYVITLALYSPVVLFAHNIFEVNIAKVYRSIAISIIFALALSVILKLLLKDWSKTGVATSLLLILLLIFFQ